MRAGSRSIGLDGVRLGGVERLIMKRLRVRVKVREGAIG